MCQTLKIQKLKMSYFFQILLNLLTQRFNPSGVEASRETMLAAYQGMV